MEFNPEITKLLQQAFGATNFATGGYSVFKLQGDPGTVTRKTYLGTPIIYPLTFKGKQYRYYKDTGEVATMQLEDFELPAVTLSTFRRSKNLSETELVAGYGSVDELYGFQDYRIEIKGLCLAEKSHPQAKTALSQMGMLRKYETVGEAIPVVSDLYRAMGISGITIKDISFEQLAGRPGVVPFRITAKQSTPKELLL